MIGLYKYSGHSMGFKLPQERPGRASEKQNIFGRPSRSMTRKCNLSRYLAERLIFFSIFFWPILFVSSLSSF